MSGRRPFFSADGTWLAAAGHDDEVLVWPETGGEPLRLPGHDILSGGWEHAGWTAPGLLVTAKGRDHAQVWSMPEGQLVRTIDFSSPTRMQMGETHLLAVVNATVLEGELRVLKLRRWKLPDGQAEDLGSIDWTALGATNSRFDPGGRGWIFARGDTVYYRPLPLRDDEPVLVIGRHDNDAAVLTPRTREPDRVWSRDMVTGERRCWSLSTPSLEPLEMIPAPPEGSRMRCAVRSGTGTWRLGRISGEKAPWLWDLGLLPGGQPLELRANTNWYASVMDMHPGQVAHGLRRKLGSAAVLAAGQDLSERCRGILRLLEASGIQSRRGVARHRLGRRFSAAVAPPHRRAARASGSRGTASFLL